MSSSPFIWDYPLHVIADDEGDLVVVAHEGEECVIVFTDCAACDTFLERSMQHFHCITSPVEDAVGFQRLLLQMKSDGIDRVIFDPLDTNAAYIRVVTVDSLLEQVQTG